MNEASCSVDQTTKDKEITKLKQNHAEEIENLTLDHKIKILELQNDFKLKEMEIESKQKQKTLDLEKEIQSLKNEIEIMKMRAQHQQTNADYKLKEENQTLKNQIALMQLKSEHAQIQADSNLRQENQTLKNQMENMKLENDKEKAAIRHEMEKKAEDLQLQIDILNLKKEQPFEDAPHGIPDRFFEGAERFLVNYNTGGRDFFSENLYKLWYEDMSRSMENRKQYANEKFVLIRKETKIIGDTNLWFVSKPKGVEHSEKDNNLIIEGLYEKTPADANVFLLHPSDYRKCMKMAFFNTSTYIGWWHSGGKAKDFSFGDTSSVIMLAEFK